ncbi:MAG: fasciclin domain-containing protein [Bacteroidaceae bacterium]|nr:fasciclin domain-containing protein [Bacteroidaceae bacterium]
MEINKRLFRKSVLAVAAAAFIGLGVSCTDIWSEQHPGTYYVNNGETVADWLDGRVQSHGDYSYFIAILQKAELWGQMRTYGTYTCFAPDNEAMEAYFKQRREDATTDSVRAVFQSLETVLQNRKLCDTIARTHIFDNSMFATDLFGSGVLEHPNMLDRYMSYTCFADTIPVMENGEILKAADGSDSTTVILKYLLNQQSVIENADDTVQNGVVHTIDRVIQSSNDFLPELMSLNPNISIFTAALFETHLRDTLRKYWDDDYPEIPYEYTMAAINAGKGVTHSTSYETDYEVIPEKREFKFTVFVVTDSVLAADYNIHNVAELREYAKTVYPEGADLDDVDRNSSLNKLLSYHILPCWLSYDQFNTSQEDIVKNHKDPQSLDIEDFFETLMPHSVMRISSPYKGNELKNRIGIFINRKGTTKNNNLVTPGIKIIDGQKGEYKGYTKICKNGEYHYVEKLLLYDDFTRNTALQCRMRIMTCTLSPDFINSGGRGRLRVDKRITYKYLPGYCTNFEWVDEQTEFYVRYRDASFGTFNGDEMTVMKSYDIAFKLPPVPSDGNYEIRIWNNAMKGTNVADRGIVQYYFHQTDPADRSLNWRNWTWNPEGIPVDLRIDGSDGRIGWISDSDLDNDEELIEINDRGMRNRGYMKAMDSYGTSSALRADKNCYRKIIANEYMRASTDYWIRIRQVYSGGTGVNPFSFIEVVPKSVYENNEDRH